MSNSIQCILASWWPQGADWLWILLIVVIIFGRKLPEVARSLGRSLGAFKKGLHEANETKDEVADELNKMKDDITKETREVKKPDDSPKTG
jgi:sec-independent protein translocase protein TatA